MKKEHSFPHIVVQMAMGAVLGVLLAFALIVTNRQLFELTTHSSSPRFLVALSIGALSGLIFTTIEMNLSAKPRAINLPDKHRDSRG